MENTINLLIDKMHEYIDMPEYNNAALVSQFVFEAVKNGFSFLDFENKLREKESRVYLIAKPFESYDKDSTKLLKVENPDVDIDIDLDNVTLGLFHPTKEKEVLTHGLYICMNGKEEADDMLYEFTIPSWINKELLETSTGFLSAI